MNIIKTRWCTLSMGHVVWRTGFVGKTKKYNIKRKTIKNFKGNVNEIINKKYINFMDIFFKTDAKTISNTKRTIKLRYWTNSKKYGNMDVHSMLNYNLASINIYTYIGSFGCYYGNIRDEKSRGFKFKWKRNT